MTGTTDDDARMADALREAVGDVSADRVFGTPVVQGDTIVLPVARIGLGGGGGGGTASGEQGRGNTGTGGGLGLAVRPLGVFVLRDGTVTWRPAVDVNRIVAGGQIVAVAALLVARAVITARAAEARRGLAYRLLSRIRSRR